MEARMRRRTAQQKAVDQIQWRSAARAIGNYEITRHRPCLINRLPIDILSYLFIFFSLTERNVRTLSLVCKRWRTAALLSVRAIVSNPAKADSRMGVQLSAAAPPAPPQEQPTVLCCDVLRAQPSSLYFSLLPSIIIDTVDRFVALNSWRSSASIRCARAFLERPQEREVYAPLRGCLANGEEFIAFSSANRNGTFRTFVTYEPFTDRERSIELHGQLLGVVSPTPPSWINPLLVVLSQGAVVPISSGMGTQLARRQIEPNQVANLRVTATSRWIRLGVSFSRLPFLDEDVPIPQNLSAESVTVIDISTAELHVAVLYECHIQIWNLHKATILSTLFLASCIIPDLGIGVFNMSLGGTVYISSLLTGEIISAEPAILLEHVTSRCHAGDFYQDLSHYLFCGEPPNYRGVHSLGLKAAFTSSSGRTVVLCSAPPLPNFKAPPRSSCELIWIRFRYCLSYYFHSDFLFFVMNEGRDDLYVVYAIDLNDPALSRRSIGTLPKVHQVHWLRPVGSSAHGMMLSATNGCVYYVPRPAIPAALQTKE